MTSNTAAIVGKVEQVKFSHTSKWGVEYLELLLNVVQNNRLDSLPVLIEKRLVTEGGLIGETVMVTGSLRTYRNMESKFQHTKVMLYARCVTKLYPYALPKNEVEFEGTVTKKIENKHAEECFSVLVSRGGYNNKLGDSIPCVASKSLTSLAAALVPGQKVSIKGCLQSRRFPKLLGNTLYWEVTYEVQAMSIHIHE